MALLVVDEITFRAAERTVLSGLSLTVQAGEMHALLGGNGAGKSTLAQMIMGCEGFSPESGTICFDGAVLNGLKLYERARLGISMAWQEPARFDGLRVMDYLSLGMSSMKPDHVLRLVGLEPKQYLNRMLDRTLSGGERKRIELASVLALRPRLAILDEPDSGIDIASIKGLVSVLEQFRITGCAVLLITHSTEVAAVADRASLTGDGRIMLTGSSEQVRTWFTEQFLNRGGSHD